ncbi:secretion-regulating guanine nucleotide exchange factor [Halyomorpha halys]|uniref:secretion-regulating guanine nucleotide exchange factor n=1 Tax=Halyomorpha halys TaxID=286706 RepID=UPI0006D4E713|nr:secretion-regulating guanine nucleotide exchange factor [Halyomorpha halys]
MTLLAWGANSYGQLGLGYRTDEVPVPQIVDFSKYIESGNPDLKKIKKIWGGGGHTLILTEEGSVYGLGWNNIGQLGSNDSGVVTDVTRLKELDDYCILDLCSTWDSCYGITEEGLCIGWGSNVYSQLGRPMDELVNTEKPIVLSEDAVQVACGVRHCIILQHNGKILSSGDYKYGQLGRKVAILDHSFREVKDLKNIDLIACGFNHSFAMNENGELYGWGVNKWGQIGIDPDNCKTVAKPTLIPVNEDYNIQEIHCGWSSTHLMTNEGVLVNFGRNNFGQLGDGTTVSRWQPKQLKGITFQKISVGSEHCLGMNVHGKLYSWGWNEHGSCGNGKNDDVLKPTRLHFEGFQKVNFFTAAVGHNFVIAEKQTHQK